ncbi:MAG: DsbE family thiol:disulfide interchange protein [Gammaproteobacteria bacterium WSBS_2016_MAG_OTU1]
MKKFLPFLIFIPLTGLFVVGLNLNPRLVPSPLINKAAPEFKVSRLLEPTQTISVADLKNEVWLFNVWASWCVSCRAEHPLLLDMQKDGIKIVGLNYKDKAQDARKWLERLDNPYVFSAMDPEGVVGLEWGVYGVPETFVIDAQGIVRHKHVGPLDERSIRETIMPLVNQLESESQQSELQSQES